MAASGEDPEPGGQRAVGEPPANSMVEAPVLRPSEEEFAEPWRFLASVRPLLEQYGMVRVIPPPTWKPRFMLDTCSVRVTVEPQRVHELFERDGVRMKFIAELREFLEARGTPLARIPVVAGRDLDLYKLYRTVTAIGGHHRVVAARRWPEVVQTLGLATAHSSYMLRQHYAKILLGYEQHLEQSSRAAPDPRSPLAPPLSATADGVAEPPPPSAPDALSPAPATTADGGSAQPDLVSELARLRAIEPPRSLSREVVQHRLLAAEARLRGACEPAAGEGRWSEWLSVRSFWVVMVAQARSACELALACAAFGRALELAPGLLPEHWETEAWLRSLLSVASLNQLAGLIAMLDELVRAVSTLAEQAHGKRKRSASPAPAAEHEEGGGEGGTPTKGTPGRSLIAAAGAEGEVAVTGKVTSPSAKRSKHGEEGTAQEEGEEGEEESDEDEEEEDVSAYPLFLWTPCSLAALVAARPVGYASNTSEAYGHGQ
ncbi:hypothetical protein T492DRAFT_906517 [Pavlovales sp. CCMP2436]|nr:hypothetical protein T492DRAFT_906517 [Pavlovales sp. CCMP2436]